MTTIMQPFNAICHHSFQKRIELRTQEQPLVANDPSRNRRTDEVPFIAGCSHFTRENTRFRAPASSPKHSPCNIMQLFQCDLAPQLQETHRTTHTGTSIVAKHIEGTKRPQPYCYVVQSLTPPFIKVSSFLMCGYVV